MTETTNSRNVKMYLLTSRKAKEQREKFDA